MDSDLSRKAEKECNENNQTRENGLKALRQKILDNTNLSCPMDEKYLLRWLRFAKFDANLAYETLINYYTIRRENHDLFDNLSPDILHDALKDGVSYVLPSKDQHGRHVMVHRHGRWNLENYNVFDLLKTDIVNLEMMAEDEASHVNGYVLLVDLGGYKTENFAHLSRRESKLRAYLLGDGFPLRLKQMVVWKPTAIYRSYFAVNSGFVSEEMTEKTIMCDEPEQLISIFGKGILPREYGNEEDMPFGNDLAQEWKAKLDSNEHLFRMKLKHEFRSQDASPTKKDSSDIVSGYWYLRSKSMEGVKQEDN